MTVNDFRNNYNRVADQAITIRRLIAPQGFGDAGLPGHKIYCPVCGDSFTHVDSSPVTIRSDDSQAWEGRGPLTCLTMECEPYGHQFSINVGFHKGESFIYVTAPEAAP